MAEREIDPRTGGILAVRVYTAGGALPVAGATVTVSAEDGEEDFLRVLYTDESGKTPPLNLAAPPASASLSPGGARPYAIYRIRVESNGYYPHENRRVPVFAGVRSVQGVELIPRSPYGDVPPVGSTDLTSEQTLEEGG